MYMYAHKGTHSKELCKIGHRYLGVHLFCYLLHKMKPNPSHIPRSVHAARGEASD